MQVDAAVDTAAAEGDQAPKLPAPQDATDQEPGAQAGVPGEGAALDAPQAAEGPAGSGSSSDSDSSDSEEGETAAAAPADAGAPAPPALTPIEGGDGEEEELPASPRGRRSSIVMALAKGVGNALGLRQRGGSKSGREGEEGAGEGGEGEEGAVGEEGGGADDAPRRRRPSLTARPPAAPGAAEGDALPLPGATFVSDAEGGALQLSPRASGAPAPAATAPPHGRSGSLTDLSIPEGEASVTRAHSMPPRRRKSILRDPSKPPSPMRGRRISFADEGEAALEQVVYCDNLHYSEGSLHEGEQDGEKCVIS